MDDGREGEGATSGRKVHSIYGDHLLFATIRNGPRSPKGTNVWLLRFTFKPSLSYEHLARFWEDGLKKKHTFVLVTDEDAGDEGDGKRRDGERRDLVATE
ncbi:Ghrelin O-acyltransferase [Anopheles sinensis]|uniref:Ghrelin O-acyltransferase n=1 Tax=Anopheles sinensis TaxID=74873 RepID=A0A084VSX9_ANOSI|nr:Ghrelin O-acyltransferase [Anopheles sinensis]